MKIEEKIVSDLAYDLKQKILSIVVEELENTTKFYYLDEKRECLTSLWEEFCVSVQDEKQEEQIRHNLKKEVEDRLSKKFNSLSYYKKIAIWLKTQEGVAWLYEHKDNSSSLDDVPFGFSDCKYDFYEELEKIALSYDSDTIYRYINLECRTFKDDFDEDERDIVYE